ncbi:MAG: 50S ribosomal protein L6 [Candidatus Jacksonbacteria bacterium]
MSRIGKQSINIPKEVEIKFDKNFITIKGPKGEINFNLPKEIQINEKENILTLTIENFGDSSQQALWGTYNRLINNGIIGVTQGFSKKLNINGVGYRANIKGQTLILEVGFSHSIEYPIPKDIKIEVENTNIIIVSGIDKQKVGQAAAEIRAFKKPEPYKGKGIIYENEVIRRKQGKQAAGSSEGGGKK